MQKMYAGKLHTPHIPLFCNTLHSETPRGKAVATRVLKRAECQSTLMLSFSVTAGYFVRLITKNNSENTNFQFLPRSKHIPSG